MCFPYHDSLEQTRYRLSFGVPVNPKYYRPSEVDTLLGDCSKAKNDLGWSPKITFDELVYDMCKNES